MPTVIKKAAPICGAASATFLLVPVFDTDQVSQRPMIAAAVVQLHFVPVHLSYWQSEASVVYAPDKVLHTALVCSQYVFTPEHAQVAAGTLTSTNPSVSL